MALRPLRSQRATLRDECQLGALIVDEQGRLLLRQRDADERLGRLWAFPGGVIAGAGEDSSGEPPAAAPRILARWLREQLGCPVQVGELFAQVPLRISGVRGSLFVYRAELADGCPPQLPGHRWLAAAERARASFGRAERVVLAAWEAGDLPAPLPSEEAAQEED